MEKIDNGIDFHKVFNSKKNEYIEDLQKLRMKVIHLKHQAELLRMEYSDVLQKNCDNYRPREDEPIAEK